jgi:hypothetical protein
MKTHPNISGLSLCLDLRARKGPGRKRIIGIACTVKMPERQNRYERLAVRNVSSRHWRRWVDAVIHAPTTATRVACLSAQY